MKLTAHSGPIRIALDRNLNREEAQTVAPTVYDLTGSRPIAFFRFAQDYAERFLGQAASAA
jgi:hypothetical protein